MTTAEQIEELKRAIGAVVEPPARFMLRVLEPPARFLDRHKPPLRMRQVLWVVTWPGSWLPWALGMRRPRMPRR